MEGYTHSTNNSSGDVGGGGDYEKMRQRDTQMALVQGNSAEILNNLWRMGTK